MNSEKVFDIITKMKQDFIAWDEFSKPCDASVKKAMVDSFELLESKLREELIQDNNTIVCGCGCEINSMAALYEHKKICEVANR